MKHIRLLSLFLILWGVAAEATPGLSLKGRLLAPNGSPLLGSAVQFRVQIRTPAPESCLMWEEVHVKDLSASSGNFKIVLADASALIQNTEPFPMESIFLNGVPFNFAAGKCAVGGPLVVTPVGATREVRIAFRDGSMAWESLPAYRLSASAYAYEANSLMGHKPNQFFRVDDGVGPRTLGPWSLSDYDRLVGIVDGSQNIAGSASGFTGSLSGDVTGSQGSTFVARLRGQPISPLMPAAGQVLRWVGGEWTPSPESSGGPPTGAAGGDLSGNYPNPGINDGAVTPQKFAAGSSSGDVHIFDGVSWGTRKLRMSDIGNNTGSSPWPATCSSGQTLNWNSVSNVFDCQALAVGSSELQAELLERLWVSDGLGGLSTLGNIGVGTSPASSGGGARLTSSFSSLNMPAVPSTVFHGVGQNSQSGTVLIDTHDTGNVARSSVLLRRSRGSVGAPGALQADDLIGLVGWVGHNGSAYLQEPSSWIRSFARGNWTAGARGSDLVFGTTASGTMTSTSRMTIHDDGRVLIGSPPAQTSVLTISSPANTHGQISIMDPVNGAAAANFRNFINGLDSSANPVWRIGVPTAEKNIVMGAWNSFYSVSLITDNQPRIFVTPAGNVGIGTTSPSEKLHVDGSLRVTGTAEGGSWNVFSDIRAKDRFSPARTGLQEIDQIQTHRFFYKKDNVFGLDSNQPRMGVIAQELQQVLPEAVRENPETGYLSVDTAPVLWTLVNAVKELSQKFAALFNRSEDLERRLASVEEENALLKAHLCAKEPSAPFCQ